jgi:U3 small nucleolar RNA-associated protein 21
VFRVPAPVTSMTLNSTGEVLATIHVESLGVYLWCNKAIHTHVSLRPLPPDIEVEVISLPSQAAKEVEITESDLQEMEVDEDEYKSPEQISEELVTLSTLATSRWINVLDLDIIKRRNKPKEAPKAPKAAPFFLPTIPSLEFKFDLRPALGEEQESGQKGVPDMTRLAKMLKETDEEWEKCVDFMKNLGPSGLDSEILSLAPEGGGSIEVMAHFVDLVSRMMQDKKDFELAHTYFALFLKHHGDQCIASDVLNNRLEEMKVCQEQSWATIEQQMLYCVSVVHALKGL